MPPRTPPPPPTGLPPTEVAGLGNSRGGGEEPAVPWGGGDRPPPPVGLPTAAGAGYSRSGGGDEPAMPWGGGGNEPAVPWGDSPSVSSSSVRATPPPPMGLPMAPPVASAEAKPTPLPPSSLPSASPPPAPSGLPGSSGGVVARGSTPAAPSGLPANPRRSGSAATGEFPPPPAALPAARTGPSESGFAAPPPPAGLPGILPAGKKAGTTAATAPPPPPGQLPGVFSANGSSGAGGSGNSASSNTASDAADEEEVGDDSWRQYLEEDVDEGETSGSGEDSDESPESQVDMTRRQSDMEMLKRQHNLSSAGYARSSVTSSQQNQGAESEGEDKSSVQSTPNGKAAIQAALDRAGVLEDLTPGSTPGRKKSGVSFISRLSAGLLGRSGANETSQDDQEARKGDGLASMMQEASKFNYDDVWYQKWSIRLGKDGLACTKVATNGKPYERRLHVDSRNLTIEIRGGRGGATGVLLDDLVDVRQGLCSPEFYKFCSHFKRDIIPPELSKRACVMETPSRTFSFLFSSEAQRDTVGHFVIYLLKSKNRGVMAAGPAGQPASRAPKQGPGSATYQNRSAYEGQFHQYMRHGFGTLTLSDGTKYECEWKNDERQGKGKEIWADGTVFAGTYVKGMRSGQGVMTWPEGSRYTGQFERGRANGDGELVRTDGSIYRGKFSEDCMSGEGHMQWRDGVEYTGQFVSNRREGLGKMAWTTGRWKSYEGYWKEGVQHGHGTLTDMNDSEFSGTFAAGKLDRWDEDTLS